MFDYSEIERNLICFAYYSQDNLGTTYEIVQDNLLGYSLYLVKRDETIYCNVESSKYLETFSTLKKAIASCKGLKKDNFYFV
jgi:hypothetical protein